VNKLWRHLSRKGLAYFIIALFLLSWVGQLFTEAATWIDEQGVQQGALSVWSAFRDADFWEQFWQSTFENWQSEFLQVATFVIATAYLVFTKSAESNDSDERIERKLDAVLDNQLVIAQMIHCIRRVSGGMQDPGVGGIIKREEVEQALPDKYRTD
jgi:hypothetical protein